MCSFSSPGIWLFLIYLQDNYRIVLFEPECLKSGTVLRSHAILAEGPSRPSDYFLRLHLCQCLIVSACRGDVLEDYREQEIENFMEELGVFDNEIDARDPRWSTPLGIQVHAYILRQEMRR